MIKIPTLIAAFAILSFAAFRVHSFSVAPHAQWIHQSRHFYVTSQRLCGERTTGARNLRMSGSDGNVSISVDSNGDHCTSVIFTQSAEFVHSLLVDLILASQEEDTNVNIQADGLLLGMEDLKRGWEELNELIEYGELLPKELDEIYRNSSNREDKLDKKGFFTLYQLIDDLFELPDESDHRQKDDVATSDAKENVLNESSVQIDSSQEESTGNDFDPTILSKEIKAQLLSYLTEIHTQSNDDNDMNKNSPCGFGCTDDERKVILDLITSLQAILSPCNLVTSKLGKMNESQVMGEWDLLYTSSHAMVINKSLSGLGRSTSSKAQFQGIRKRLGGNKYLGTAEYIETFGGEEASFEVIVTGEWYIEKKRQVPSMRMELQKVMYGPTTNGADQWSSLGPVKLTDFLYLDDDLMILRGNANTNSLFIYQRVGASS